MYKICCDYKWCDNQSKDGECDMVGLFTDENGRCGCASLEKLGATVAIGLPNEVGGGPPNPPVPIGTGPPLLAGGNTIEVECGGSLGICIATNTINYRNTCAATNQPFLISPATFSLKAKPKL